METNPTVGKFGVKSFNCQIKRTTNIMGRRRKMSTQLILWGEKKNERATYRRNHCC